MNQQTIEREAAIAIKRYRRLQVWLNKSIFGESLKRQQLTLDRCALYIFCSSLWWRSLFIRCSSPLFREAQIHLGIIEVYISCKGVKAFMIDHAVPHSDDYKEDMEILDKLMSDPHSGALVSSNHKLIAANRQITSTAGKDPLEIVGQDMRLLWDQEALNDLTNHLRRSGEVKEYEYSAYGWEKEGKVWVRKRTQFCGNFQIVHYMGEPCRLSSVVTVS
jgi:hypothetical protein